MTFDEYQKIARSTAVYDNDLGAIYTALGLAGEAGEVVEHIKKMVRDNSRIPTPERREAIKKELGDVLWYVANLAADLDIGLEDVVSTNLAKIKDRSERGVLHGAGDDR